jgi:hypothetical protein
MLTLPDPNSIAFGCIVTSIAGCLFELLKRNYRKLSPPPASHEEPSLSVAFGCDGQQERFRLLASSIPNVCRLSISCWCIFAFTPDADYWGMGHDDLTVSSMLLMFGLILFGPILYFLLLFFMLSRMDTFAPPCSSVLYEVIDIALPRPLRTCPVWSLSSMQKAVRFMRSWRSAHWIALANAMVNVCTFTYQAILCNSGDCAYQFSKNGKQYIGYMICFGLLVCLVSACSLYTDSRAEPTAFLDRSYRASTALKIGMLLVKALLVRSQMSQDMTLYSDFANANCVIERIVQPTSQPWSGCGSWSSSAPTCQASTMLSSSQCLDGQYLCTNYTCCYSGVSPGVYADAGVCTLGMTPRTEYVLRQSCEKRGGVPEWPYCYFSSPSHAGTSLDHSVIVRSCIPHFVDVAGQD